MDRSSDRQVSVCVGGRGLWAHTTHSLLRDGGWITVETGQHTWNTNLFAKVGSVVQLFRFSKFKLKRLFKVLFLLTQGLGKPPYPKHFWWGTVGVPLTQTQGAFTSYQFYHKNVSCWLAKEKEKHPQNDCEVWILSKLAYIPLGITSCGNLSTQAENMLSNPPMLAVQGINQL